MSVFFSRAQRRRKVFTKLPELQLPELMIGYPNVEMEKTPAPITIGEALKGTPVSTGKVRAPVRVAKNLQDAAELKVKNSQIQNIWSTSRYRVSQNSALNQISFCFQNVGWGGYGNGRSSYLARRQEVRNSRNRPNSPLTVHCLD